jgi:hypothetical protein
MIDFCGRLSIPPVAFAASYKLLVSHGFFLPNWFHLTPYLRLISTIDQRVRWQARIEHLAGRFPACDGQGSGIKQTKLDKHGGLVPINVLVGQLTIPESDNRDHRDLNALPCRS